MPTSAATPAQPMFTGAPLTWVSRYEVVLLIFAPMSQTCSAMHPKTDREELQFIDQYLSP